MDRHIKELLDLDDVKGVMLVSFDGEPVFEQFYPSFETEIEGEYSWTLFIHSLRGAREVEVFYENARMYIRRTEAGYLFVITGGTTPMAMVRLNCDMVAPSLKKLIRRDKLKGLFRRK